MDLTPLLRASVGFDRMMDLLDSATRLDESAFSYPPYNIEKLGEDEYRIVMAVAGFGEDDLDIAVQEGSLVITGRKSKDESEGEGEGEADAAKYLYRGIATRAFERRFDLVDHIKVTGARLENGLLFVDLVREVPEAMKPRSIRIETSAGAKRPTIEGKAA